MPEPEDGWLAQAAEPLREPLRACAAGDLPPNVALMRMLVEARGADEVETALTGCIARLERGPERPGALRHLRQALILLRNNPKAFETVHAVIDGVEHAAARDGVAHWAAVFDRAARTSGEAGVALYSLGDSELLRDATGEVVARMRDWGLLGPNRAALEIGCGIGRFEEALAHDLGLCVGIDVSGEMIAAAQQRCAGLRNVRLLHTPGRDLSAFDGASFDLVFAVDSFPYLVLSGLADDHVREGARVLKPGGSLLILNFSYRGAVDADCRDLRRSGDASGLALVRDGTRPFALWDGAAFELRKPA